MKKYMRDRYARRREDALEYLGGRCLDCGSEENLQFDHIDPSSKEFNIGKILAGANEDKLYRELNKCQLLCEDCHKAKSKRENANGNIARKMTCGCGRIFDSIKAYAGHKTWCKK